MNELEMIQLLNVLTAFLGGAAIGMTIMMLNYGFFHRAVELFRQKKRAARGMATRNKRKKTCVSHKFNASEHEPHEVDGLPKPLFPFTTEALKAYKPRTWSDVKDTDQKPPAYNDLDFILDVEAANPHKLYDVIYMCDTQGEVLATDLSYGDAQATVRCLAEDMHEEQIADLVIREVSDDNA